MHVCTHTRAHTHIHTRTLLVIYFANNSSMLQMSFSFVFVFSPPFICGGGRGGLVAELCSTLVTPRTAACQPPLSVQFPRQEYWSVLPFPSSSDLSDPGIKPTSQALKTNSLQIPSTKRTLWPPDWVDPHPTSSPRSWFSSAQHRNWPILRGRKGHMPEDWACGLGKAKSFPVLGYFPWRPHRRAEIITSWCQRQQSSPVPGGNPGEVSTRGHGGAAWGEGSGSDRS